MLTGHPSRPLSDGDDRISQVPGGPACTCPALRPRWDLCARPLLRIGVAFRGFDGVGSHNELPFGAQSHGPHICCLRFAARVTPAPRKTRFRPLACVTGRDWLPARSHCKVSTHRIPLTQASPGAPKLQSVGHDLAAILPLLIWTPARPRGPRTCPKWVTEKLPPKADMEACPAFTPGVPRCGQERDFRPCQPRTGFRTVRGWVQGAPFPLGLKAEAPWHRSVDV